jgi:hypothetical protein
MMNKDALHRSLFPNMITKEKIQEQISELKIEQATLQSSHEKLIREHQQRVEVVQQTAGANAARMQQIMGAIEQLTQLMNGETEGKEP